MWGALTLPILSKIRAGISDYGKFRPFLIFRCAFSSAAFPLQFTRAILKKIPTPTPCAPYLSWSDPGDASYP